MGDDKPRLARLTAMIIQLQSKRIVTAKDIAEKHGVSIRTVYRDIRTLEMSGIPVVTEEGKGYSMMEGYNMPPVMFTEAEAHAIVTAEQLMLANKDRSLVEHYQSAVVKVKAILKLRQKDQTELLGNRIQVRANQSRERTSNCLMDLQSALTKFQVVNIRYLSLEHVLSERVIEPFALYTTKENWVLVAFCQSKKAFRAFRLDCVQDLQLTGERFEPHKMTLEEYLKKCADAWKP